MTLQELNDYIQDVISDEVLQKTCGFILYDNSGPDSEWQDFGFSYKVKEGVYHDEYGGLVFHLYGGLNGLGDWVNYLNGLIDVITAIEGLPEVEYAYVLDISNDAPDDMFNCVIAIHPLNKDDFED